MSEWSTSCSALSHINLQSSNFMIEVRPSTEIGSIPVRPVSVRRSVKPIVSISLYRYGRLCKKNRRGFVVGVRNFMVWLEIKYRATICCQSAATLFHRLELKRRGPLAAGTQYDSIATLVLIFTLYLNSEGKRFQYLSAF
jgi:hypothetical protein